MLVDVEVMVRITAVIDSEDALKSIEEAKGRVTDTLKRAFDTPIEIDFYRLEPR